MRREAENPALAPGSGVQPPSATARALAAGSPERLYGARRERLEEDEKECVDLPEDASQAGGQSGHGEDHLLHGGADAGGVSLYE